LQRCATLNSTNLTQAEAEAEAEAEQRKVKSSFL